MVYQGPLGSYTYVDGVAQRSGTGIDLWPFDISTPLPNLPPVVPIIPKPIYCQADVIQAMDTAWAKSGNAGMSHPNSQPFEGAFNLNGTPSNYKIDPSYTNQVGKMTIRYSTLFSPTPTFANFHVHPKGFDGNNGLPSTPKDSYVGKRGDTGAFDDIYAKTGQAIQVYVMSWKGLSVYDPVTGQSTPLVNGTGFLKGDECSHQHLPSRS